MSPPYFGSSRGARFTIVALFLITPFLSVNAINTTIGSTLGPIPKFSTFDLFKNSGLTPCSLANQTTAFVQGVQKRSPDPRGGGGGHGGGGGGGHSSGGHSSSSSGGSSGHSSSAYGGSAYSLSALVYEAWVKKGDHSYCKYINSTQMPIIVPTTLADLAFIPLYPTIIIQLISLIPSFWGLRISFDKYRSHGRFTPWFWPQFGFDMARFIAWYIRIFQGFIVQDKLAWMNVWIWMLNFAYFLVFHSIRRIRADHASSSDNYGMVIARTETSYKPVDNVEAHPLEPTHLVPEDPGYEKSMPSTPGYGEDADKPLINSDDPPYIKNPGMFQHLHHGGFPLRPLTIAFLISTIVSWSLTLVINIFHRFPFSLGHKFTQSLVPLPVVSSDPASLAANMPSACVDYLRNGNLAAQGLYAQLGDKEVSALFENGQFIFTTLIAFHVGFSLFRGRKTPDEPFRIAACLKTMAFMASLIMPMVLLANTIFLTVSVFGEHAAVNVVFTNNATTTANCSFATIGMDKRFGYFDVKEGLGFRIGQSALGIA